MTSLEKGQQWPFLYMYLCSDSAGVYHYRKQMDKSWDDIGLIVNINCDVLYPYRNEIKINRDQGYLVFTKYGPYTYGTIRPEGTYNPQSKFWKCLNDIGATYDHDQGEVFIPNEFTFQSAPKQALSYN
jgi:hypothetical protein